MSVNPEMPSDAHGNALALGIGFAIGVGVSIAARHVLKKLEAPALSEAQELATMEPYLTDITAGLDRYDYRLVGGMPIDVVNDPRTIIDVSNRQIIAPPDFTTPQYRTNRTTRDHDILVIANPSGDVPSASELSDLNKRLQGKSNAKAGERFGIAEGAVISIFSFDDPTRDYGAFTQYNSGTTREEDGHITLRHGTVALELPAAALEPWTMNIAGIEVPVLDPRVQIWRSRTRFMSGTKTKDEEKLAVMEARLSKEFGADWESDLISTVFRDFYDQMLHGSTVTAAREVLDSTEPALPKANKMRRVLGRILLRHVGSFANNNKTVAAFFQARPKQFNGHVGAATSSNG